MKKTLFLSAILGAALCSSAFATSLTTDTSVVDGVTYNGGVFSIAEPTATFHSVGKSADVTSTNGTITVGSSIHWHAFASNGTNADYGHTIHLTQAGTYTTNFSPFTFGGLIVDAGLTDGVTLGRSDTATEIIGNSAVNMTIGSDTTILGDSAKDSLVGITVKTGGTWNIADGQTLTLSAASQGVHFSDDVNVTLTGTGTLNFKVNTTTILPKENGFGTLGYRIGNHITQNGVSLQLNGQEAKFEDGALMYTEPSTTYCVVKSAAFGKADMSSYSDATAFEIANGATLSITEAGGSGNGIIHGAVTVKNGSVLQLQHKDALGWQNKNVTSLLVEDGAEVKLTHSDNETFGGALTLQGTGKLTGDNARWDFYDNSSITVAASANAAINTKELMLRHGGNSQATISMGNSATLTIAAQITNTNETNHGDGSLVMTAGNGSNSIVNLNGGATGVALQFGGVTANINSDMTLTKLMLSKNDALTTVNVAAGKTVTITGTTMPTSNGSFELANWAHNNILNIEGTLIANSGITTEGDNACPVVNIKNGGTLTMNAGLNAVNREGGSSFTTINVESGATLNMGGTAGLADTTRIVVNVKDGATLGGAYGTGNAVVVNKNLTLADNATVTLQTAAEKSLTLNGTLSNATASLVAQGGGTLTLGGTEAISAITIQENTNLVFAGDTTIGTALTMGTGATIVNNGSLTLKGSVAVTGTAHDSDEALPTSGNGFGVITTTATLSGIIGGTVNTAGVTSWTLNGHAATLTDGVLSYTSETGNYYVNETESSGITEDVTVLNMHHDSTISNSEFTVTSYADVAAATTLSLSGTTMSAQGGVWIHNNSTMELDATSKIIADGLTISGGTITKIDNGRDAAQIGDHSTSGFHSGVLLTGSDITADSTLVRNYVMNGGSLTVTQAETTVKATLSADTNLVVEGGASAQFSETAQTIGTLTLGDGANVTLGTQSSHDAALSITGLKVTGSASIDADLVMNSGKLIFTDDSILTMGCDVTIGDSVTVVLTDAMVQSIRDGVNVAIIAGVDKANLSQSITFIGSGDLSDYVTEHAGVYQLTQVGDKIYITPEPATATLSLLALAALCARRKRH